MHCTYSPVCTCTVHIYTCVYMYMHVHVGEKQWRKGRKEAGIWRKGEKEGDSKAEERKK